MSEHRCHRAAQCSHWERVEGKKLGAQIEAEIGLCEACRRHLEEVLPKLTEDYATLSEAIGESGTADGQTITFTRELSVPLRLSVDALRIDIVRASSLWAEVCARVMSIDSDTYSDDHTRPHVLLERCTKLLSRAVSVLLAVRDEDVAVWSEEQSSDLNRKRLKGSSEMSPPAEFDLGYIRKGQWDYETQHGVDGAVRLIDLHHQTRRLLGLTKARYRYRLPCPRCEGQLSREYGSDMIDCDHCDRHYTLDEYEQLCLLLARRKEAS